jgi:hypothetical protein
MVEKASTTPASFTTYWRSGHLADSFFDTPSGRRWPLQPFVKSAGILAVPLEEYNNAVTGVAYAEVAFDTTAETYVPSSPVHLPQAYSATTAQCSGTNNRGLEFGDGALVKPDGVRTYLYGIESCNAPGLGVFNYLHLASVTGSDLCGTVVAGTCTQTWSYWTGAAGDNNPATSANWSSDKTASIRIQQNGAASALHAGDGRFRHLHVELHLPVGPFRSARRSVRGARVRVADVQPAERDLHTDDVQRQGAPRTRERR